MQWEWPFEWQQLWGKREVVGHSNSKRRRMLETKFPLPVTANKPIITTQSPMACASFSDIQQVLTQDTAPKPPRVVWFLFHEGSLQNLRFFGLAPTTGFAAFDIGFVLLCPFWWSLLSVRWDSFGSLAHSFFRFFSCFFGAFSCCCC